MILKHATAYKCKNDLKRKSQYFQAYKYNNIDVCHNKIFGMHVDV